MARGSLAIVGQAEARRERADAALNRARIMDAAKKHMRKHSLDELCMDALAEAAGVGKGTLYRRFADKSALLHALLDDEERVLQRDVQKLLSRRGPPAGAVVDFLDLLLAFSMDNAKILVVAEASATKRARLNHAPYAWRHQLLAELLSPHSATPAAARHTADMLLQAMAPDVLLRALELQSRDRVRHQTRAFFHAALPEAAASTERSRDA